MNRVGNDHQFFVIGLFAVGGHILERVLAEIAGVRLFAVDDQYC